MNQIQIGSLIRSVIIIIAGFFFKDGLDNSTIEALVGGIGGLIAAGWGIWAKTHTNLVASVVAVDPKTIVVTDPTIAKSLAISNVVSLDAAKVVTK